VTRTRSQLEQTVRELKAERDRLAEARLGRRVGRLLHLYGWLRVMSDPLPSRSLDAVGRSSWRDRSMPGAATYRYRAALRRVDRRLDALNAEIQASLEGGPPAPKGRSCPGCNRRGRTGARYCDSCGTELEEGGQHSNQTSGPGLQAVPAGQLGGFQPAAEGGKDG